MPRHRQPRLADIAAAAAVSIATASRTLTRPELVKAETRRRVRAAALRLGAMPLRGAASQGTVAAIVPTLENAIFSRALEAMQTVLAGNGRSLLVASSGQHPATEAAAIQDLLARGIDGLVLVGAERAEEIYAALEEAGIPVVLTWCGDARFASVTVDNAGAGRLAAEHLLGLGHRRIGVICGATRHNDRQRARREGVRAALAARGLPLPEWLVAEADFTLAGARAACSAMLSLAEPPSAIICGIDLLAVGCLVEAQARGLSVPRDLSVVGIDNLEMAAHLSPALTTVHVPTARIGEEAARAVMASGRAARAIELPIELVVRRSTARVAAGAESLAPRRAPGGTSRAEHGKERR
jgi:LacI family transcriptional regulator